VSVAGKLCDPSSTRAIPERLRGELLIIKRYTNKDFTSLPEKTKLKETQWNRMTQVDMENGGIYAIHTCWLQRAARCSNGNRG